jgi:hypothetical protein
MWLKAVPDARAQLIECCNLPGPRPTGDQRAWLTPEDCEATQHLTQKPLGCSSLSTLLDQDVEHLAILIHGAPQVVLPSPYLDEHFVDVPGIAEPALPALECSAVARSELQAPAAYRLVRRSHARREDPPHRGSSARSECRARPHG